MTMTAVALGSEENPETKDFAQKAVKNRIKILGNTTKKVVFFLIISIKNAKITKYTNHGI